MNWNYLTTIFWQTACSTKHIILLFVLLFSFCAQSNASNLQLNDASNAVPPLLKKHSPILQSDETEQHYDVLHYDISLDWHQILTDNNNTNLTEKYWDGTVVITVKATADAITHIPLDATDLDILSVFINQVPVFPTPAIADYKLVIPLFTPLSKGDVSKITINYRYKTFAQVGFNLHYKNIGKSIDETIAYTFNSPKLARFWLPCNDAPGDKAAIDLHVIVPANYAVAANGKLAERVNYKIAGQNITEFHWADTTPIATYLINVVASVFEEYSEWFHSNSTGTNIDSTEIKYFIWKNDLKKAKAKLQETKKALEYFSSIFTEYGFCKYGWVEVYPFQYTGMENQTVVNINKNLIAFDDIAVPNIIAHEISHHWFGNLVSPKGWNDVWFKEGAATWCEALWAAAKHSDQPNREQYYFDIMLNHAKQYKQHAGTYSIPLYGNSSDVFFNIPYVFLTYNKASWLFHQLNMLLGQAQNLQILKELLTKYAYKSIDASDFISAYKDALSPDNIGFDIDTYFNQWLFGAGHPQYHSHVLRVQDNTITDSVVYKTVNVVLSQEQNAPNVADVFEMPVWLVFYNQNQIVHTEKVFNNKRVQEYCFNNIPEFTSCGVDTLRTLCQNRQTITSILDDTPPDDYCVYPNPAVQQNRIYISIKNENMLTAPLFNSEDIVVIDMLGNMQNVECHKLTNQFEIDISNLTTGLYYIKLGRYTTKITVIK